MHTQIVPRRRDLLSAPVWRAVKRVSGIIGLEDDPVGLARPPWFDASKYQGSIDMTVAAETFWGCYLRAGVGWGYADPEFAGHYAAAGEAGLYRTSYHVLWTDLDVQAQFEHWISIHPHIDTIPRVIDLEADRGDSNYHKATVVKQMSDMVLEYDGQRPIIYSRANIIQPWLDSWSDTFLNQHYFILANYLYNATLEHPGPPSRPERMNENRVILHQTCDHKNAPVDMISSASQDLDWDRWELGDEVAMQSFIEEQWGDGLEPQPVTGDLSPEWALEITQVVESALGVALPDPIIPPNTEPPPDADDA